ncbi:hypothetical protein BDP27DRAFT_38174 [Rhodocollybia butyracea]|uniref:Uncharacterized protein n=1 Tax=Rhodocollybia butyracea TaxID=206335 RepID=A0A9P5Q7S0_9AGAR|nr:hypothetical protein BDP27DRAFT_38174 [Rhodocollybia butyracea]
MSSSNSTGWPSNPSSPLTNPGLPFYTQGHAQYSSIGSSQSPMAEPTSPTSELPSDPPPSPANALVSQSHWWDIDISKWVFWSQCLHSAIVGFSVQIGVVAIFQTSWPLWARIAPPVCAVSLVCVSEAVRGYRTRRTIKDVVQEHQHWVSKEMLQHVVEGIEGRRNAFGAMYET